MMNDMATEGDMNGASNNRLVPELRFPEFKKNGKWEEKKLGECLLQSPDYGLNAPAVPYSTKLPTYLRITDISDDGKFIKEGKVSVNAVLTEANSLQDGDIVLARTGASVGKPYIYRKEDGKLIFAGFLIRIKPDTVKYNSDFIFQYLLTDTYKKWVRIVSVRSGQPGINSNEYSSLCIPCPSHGEQQKIAECLSSVDEKIGAIKEKVEQLKIHKKGLLQTLFPKDGNFVPELRFPEFKKNWIVDSMQSIFDIKNGYTPSKSNPTFWDKGTVPWFRMEDIRKNGHILSDSIQHVTQQAVKNSGLFPAYSIIVATTATIGEHALIAVDSLANQRFTFLTRRKSFKYKINMMYFNHYMFIIDEWCKKNTNSGGLLSVNMPAFKQLLISYPSPAEQHKIAQCLSSIDELISLYENKASMLEQHKKGLMQRLFPKL